MRINQRTSATLLRLGRPARPVVRGEAREDTASSPTTTFEVDAYDEFCAKNLEHLDDVAHAWFTSGAFDDLLVETVRTTFPAHEHEHFVAHYRGLLAAWARDESS